MRAARTSTHDPMPEGRHRHAGRRGRRASFVGVLIAALMAVAAPTASAAPFSCDAFGYLFQYDGATASVAKVDLATGQYTTIPGGTGDAINAVGYNSIDNFFYAWDVVTHQMVRINDDMSLTQLGVPLGVNGATDYHVGDIDPSGHYWMTNLATWYEIDLTTPIPTVLRSGAFPASPAGLTGGADWAWINGYLYHVYNDTTTHEAYLYRFDPMTGTETNMTPGGLGFTVTDPATGNSDFSGAVYADASGYLYASFNITGAIYRIDPATLQSIKVADGPPGAGNDGARCALAPIPTITVTKTVDGRVRPTDQFTVGLTKPDGKAGTSATTSGTATTASTTNFPASQGQTYTITDAMAAGSPTPLGEYIKSISCKDSTGATVTPTGSAPSWRLTVANATAYTCNVTNKAQADLALEKTASPIPAVPGTNETYSFKVTNSGPSTATNVTVTDPLPSGLTYVSGSSGCTSANGTVTCTLAALAPGTSHTFTVTTKVKSSADGCADLRNTATVSSAVFDPDTSNNSSQICPDTKGKSDLSITKTPSQTQVPSGGQVMYTLTVKNDGPSDTTGVTVSDPMASGLKLVSASPSQGSCSTANGQLSCSIGTLAAGGSAQVLVTAQATATGGDVTNKASVTGDNEDPDPGDNADEGKITVTPGPDPKFDLEMSKTANHGTITAGQSVTYKLVVTNKGPEAAPDVKVTDTLSAPATIQSVKTTQGTCTRSSPITCALGTIAAGANVTITVVARPKVSGRLRNAASVTGDGTDVDPSDNLDREDVAVKVRLRLTKVANRTTVAAGGRITYTIKVTNLSRTSADDVRVCDTLPSGLVYVSSSPRARLSGGRQCWTISRLGARRSRTFRLTARALSGADGYKANRVTAGGLAAKTASATAGARVLGTRSGPPPVTG